METVIGESELKTEKPEDKDDIREIEEPVSQADLDKMLHIEEKKAKKPEMYWDANEFFASTEKPKKQAKKKQKEEPKEEPQKLSLFKQRMLKNPSL